MQAVGAGNWTNPPTPIGLIIGGTGLYSDINSIIIPTTGNATDFGSLAASRGGAATFGSATTGFIAGNDSGSNNNFFTQMTFSSTGTTSYFGDTFTSTLQDKPTGASDKTRGIVAGGYNAGTLNVIQYITMSTAGNAQDFGDLTVARDGLSGSAWNSPTKCFFTAGSNSANATVNIIDQITTQSTGNATDFGDCYIAVNDLGACSNATTGIVAGGRNAANTRLNVIQYASLSSSGNTTDFGDLTVITGNRPAGMSSSTRAVFAGGYDGAAELNVIQYVTIATTGNATDFGDLTVASYSNQGCSNSHGGL